MTEKRFSVKIISAFLLALILLGSFSVFSFAADDIKNLKEKYGLIVPTDSKLKAQKSSYTFYGDSGKLYFMRISKGQKGAKFAVEIYSDSGYQNQIRSYTDEYSKTPGNKPFLITWNFKDVKSGTYYGRCYTYIENDSEEKTIDSASLETFKININRVGKKVVPLTKISNTSTGVYVQWEPLPTANKYYFYRKDPGSTKWVKLATLGSDKTSFTDTTAKSGKQYTYTVKCDDGKYYSLYEKKGVSIIYLSTPVLKPVTAKGAAGNAVISWNKVSGAKGYYVYRKGGSLSEYKWVCIATIKNGKTTSYIDTKAKSSDWNYTYTVRAYNGKVKSYYDGLGVDFDYIAAPKLTKAFSYYGGVKIQWTNNNDNVINYSVYRVNGKSWLYLGNTRNNYFIDTTAVSNKSYTYTVKAFSETNAGAFNSKGISCKFIATPELKPVTFNANAEGIVSWSKVTGAYGYNVYRKVNGAAKWSLIKTIKGGNTTKFIDTVDKESGDTFTYTVRALDNKNKLGYYDLDGITGTYLSKPVFQARQVVIDNSGILAIGVNWETVTGATKYNFYKRIPGKAWVCIAEGTTELNYIDTDVENGKIYDYAVRALTDNGDISAYDIRSSYAIIVPELNSVVVEETGVKLSWTASEAAAKYNVYRAAEGSDTWTLIGSSETTEYIDTTPECLTEHFRYQISSVVGKIESSRYEGIGNFIELSSSAEFIEEDKTISLKWSASDDAKITIEKSVNDEPAIIFMADCFAEGEINDNLIEEGLAYTYTITAKAEGKLSSTVSVSAKYPHPPLEKAVITNLEAEYIDNIVNCILQWNGVNFADEYVILRAADGEEFEEIQTITADKGVEGKFIFTDINVPADGKYVYAIKAIATQSERDSSLSDNSDEITVYEQLTALTNLKISNTEKNEDGKISLTLSWASTDNAEKYIIERTTASTGKTVILTEITPEVEIEGAEPVLKTFFTDKTVDENVRYHYRVTAVAENRGKVSSIIENYCWGEAKASYGDYNYEKNRLETIFATGNLNENEKPIYVQDVFDEAKAAFEEADAALVKDLPEESQATVDAAAESLNVIYGKLESNMIFTITFKNDAGDTLSQIDFVDSVVFGDVDKPLLPENTETSISLGWATTDNVLIEDFFTLEESLTLYAAHETNKLLLKEEPSISFDGEFIHGIESGATVALLKTELQNDLTYVVIKDYLGNDLADDALVGTGTTVSLVSKYTGETYETKSVVIVGEVTGDGIIDEKDTDKLTEAAASCEDAYTFNGVYLHCFTLASDVNGDGFVDMFDYL